MKPVRSTCDPHAIKLFVVDELDSRQQTTLFEHLDNCDTCRTELERQSAEDNFWLEASDFLSNDELDSELPATLHATLSGTEENRIPKGAISGVVDHLNPSDDPRMMGRFGGYEIVGVIGCGGMGVVLKGHETALNRYVAIKVLAPHLAMSGAARVRFSREGQAAASVVHPNVVAIHRVSESDGLPFLVMPYVGGESLQRRINDDGPLPVQAVVRIGLQVCRGLAAAHAQGLVHRDIKPANILLEQDVDRVILTDFGLARAADDASMTNTGVLAGTPQYMSPEQARGERVDQRSDLFSIGSVLFTLCTGRPPFRSETSYGILRKIPDTQPRPIREINPDIPDWLVRLIERLHAKHPDDRFQTADEVAELLEHCLAHLQQPESQPIPDVLQRTRTYKKLPWIGLLTGIVVLGVLFTVSRLTDRTQSENSTRLVEPLNSSVASPDEQPIPTDSSPSHTKIQNEHLLPTEPQLSNQQWHDLENIFEDVNSVQSDIDRIEQILDADLAPTENTSSVEENQSGFSVPENSADIDSNQK